MIVPIGGAARIGPLTEVIAEHPGTWNRRRRHRGPSTLGTAHRAAALTELLDLLDALGVPARTGAGPGARPADRCADPCYPTAARRPSSRRGSICLPRLQRRDAARRWVHVHAKGGPLRDRYGWFAAGRVEVWPIFSPSPARSTWPRRSEAFGLNGVEARLEADLAADPAYGQLAVTGFAYFTLGGGAARGLGFALTLAPAARGRGALRHDDERHHPATEISARVGLPGDRPPRAPGPATELTRPRSAEVHAPEPDQVAFLAAAADGEINDAEADNLGEPTSSGRGPELPEETVEHVIERFITAYYYGREARLWLIAGVPTPRLAPAGVHAGAPGGATPPSSSTIISSTCWRHRHRPQLSQDEAEATFEAIQDHVETVVANARARSLPSAHGTGSFSAYQ